jgi:tetratricopeptide (TPR) repeat protein
MRIPLKKLREAASRAIEVARTGPADTLKNVTENMLDRASATGLPPDATAAGSAAAARLWTKVAPQDPMAQARLAEALVRDGRPGEALQVVELAAQDRSDAALLAQSWLARAEGATDQQDAALHRLRRLAAQFGQAESTVTATGRAVAASAALDCCQTDLAEQLLGEARHLQAQAPPLYVVAQARLALVAGQPTRAYDLLSAGAASQTEEGRAWRAVALALLGETQQARFSLELLRPRGPERPWVEYGLGWLQLLAGDHATAQASLTRSSEALPHLAGPRYLVGLIAEKDGQTHDARQAYRKASRQQPSWSPPWLGLLRTSLAAGDHAGAREAAQQAGADLDNALLAGLALSLAGDAAGAEQRWLPAAGAEKDRQRDISTLRAAVASHLTHHGRHEAAAAAWKTVADRASHAGSTRLTLARWALDAARHCLDSPQPPYYVIEAALAAASALRPDRENLVVAHCAASMLARGPAAARTALQDALGRGASDDRITGLLGLLDSITTGAQAPVLAVGRDNDVHEAAQLARDGDSAACLARVDELATRDLTPVGQALVAGARAVLRLTDVTELLRQGKFDDAAAVLRTALEHLPQGLDRDRVIHELAAVCAIAARRHDRQARQEGDPPPQPTLLWWQEALSYWASLDSSPAYWADLSRRVLELDDPRLNGNDVSQLRANLAELALAHPADYAAEALTAGQPRRARAFVAVIIGAPFGDGPRSRALERALSPLTREIRSVSDEAKKAAAELAPDQLLAAYGTTQEKIHSLRRQLDQAAPDHIEPVINACDELATALQKFFENLHDRAGERSTAWNALCAATEMAGTETLRSELEGKQQRLGKKK